MLYPLSYGGGDLWKMCKGLRWEPRARANRSTDPVVRHRAGAPPSV